MEKGNRKTTGKIINAVILFIILCLVIVALVCINKTAETLNDYKESEEEYRKLQSYVTVVEEVKEDSVEEVYPHLNIDWEALRAINSDIVGWIYIPDTIVNYPIVQGETNDTYLRTSFEKKKSSVGCIFMECKNSSDFSDKNTILYGHNMRNGSMFACLKNFRDQTYLDSHSIIQIYTPEWDRTYKVISAHTDINTGSSYRISFYDTPYEDWLSEMALKSAVKGQEASKYKDTVTLSVCHGKSGTTDRMVLNIQVAD